MTTTVFLTSASSANWPKPSDWTDAGHTVEMISAGGKGGDGTTGTSRVNGTGGGGGVYVKLTYSSGALGATTAFIVHDNNTLTTYNVSSSTIWQGDDSQSTRCRSRCQRLKDFRDMWAKAFWRAMER